MSDRSADDEQWRSMTHDDNDEDGFERRIDESLGASAQGSADGPLGGVDRGSNDKDVAAVDDAYQESKVSARRCSDAGEHGDGVEEGASPLHDANGQRSSPFDENASSSARQRDVRADVCSANDDDEVGIVTSPLGGEAEASYSSLPDYRERSSAAEAGAGEARAAELGTSFSPDHARNTNAGYGSASAAGEQKEESDTAEAAPAPTGTGAGAGPMIIAGEGANKEVLQDEKEGFKPPARRDWCAVDKTEEDEEEEEEKIEVLPPLVLEDTKLPAAAYSNGAVAKPTLPSGTVVTSACGQTVVAKVDGQGNDAATFACARSPPRGSSGDGIDAKLVGAAATAAEEGGTSTNSPAGHQSYYPQGVPGAFLVSGPNEGRENEASDDIDGIREANNAAAEEEISSTARNPDGDDGTSSNWRNTPGAYLVTTGVAPPNHSPRSWVSSSAAAQEEDHMHHLAVLDAHVAPSEEDVARHTEEQRQHSLYRQIRERLMRNVPLVEATLTVEQDEVSGEGSRRPSLRITAAPTSSASSPSLRSQFLRTASSLLRSPQQSDSGEIGVESGGAHSSLNRARTDAQVSHADEEQPGNRTNKRICARWTSRRTWTALALFAAAAALVLGLSIPLSRQSSSPSANAAAEASPPTSVPTSTTAPTLAPTLSEKFLLTKETVGTVSSEVDFSNPQSPQYKALSWLATLDTTNISATDQRDKLIQRFIAAVFFFSTVNAPGADTLEEIMIGDECTWNRPGDENSWGMPKGVTCSENGHIISINFGSYFRPISGTFPHETGYLPRLRHLIVSRNPDIIGTIPNSVSKLQDLERVLIGQFGHRFGGTIPPFTAPNVRQIIIGVAPFNGTIPSSIGNLTKLVTLSVAGTDITGTVPEFVADLKELAVLNMGNNKLSGTIPASLGNDQNDLVVVNFGNNTINGTIPGGLLDRDNLRGLFLHINHLTGTVGSEFGLMTNLKRLVLHSNFLSSTIPPEIGNITSLEFLELGNNILNGTVPASLGDLLNLESISLEGNSGLHGDLNFFCDKSLSNFVTDCVVSNPNLDCDCCDCCSGSTFTCGHHLDSETSETLWRMFFYTECCILKQCGKIDHCTGRSISY